MGTSTWPANVPRNVQQAVARGLSSQVVPYLLDYGQFRQHIQMYLSAMHRWDTCHLLPTLYILQRNSQSLHTNMTWLEEEVAWTSAATTWLPGGGGGSCATSGSGGGGSESTSGARALSRSRA